MKIWFLVCAVILSGCTNSAYDSGWNGDTSLKTFHECAATSPSKNFYYDQNADRLVQLDLLTQAEANRAKQHRVMVGDKECLAYAAYGMRPSKYIFATGPGKEKKLLSKTVEYRCADSQIPCPGNSFTIADGKVIAINQLK